MMKASEYVREMGQYCSVFDEIGVVGKLRQRAFQRRVEGAGGRRRDCGHGARRVSRPTEEFYFRTRPNQNDALNRPYT